jgi:hypothetical protein
MRKNNHTDTMTVVVSNDQILFKFKDYRSI